MTSPGIQKSSHSDGFSTFLSRAAKTPLLTHDEEITLGRQVRAWLDNPNPDALTIRKGQRAKHRLIQANIRLVVNIAKRHQNRGIEISDMVQEGCLGLHRAAELFDPAKGYRFSTYAYDWIRQAIMRAIETHGRAVRLPNHIHELLTSAHKEVARFAQQNGQKPNLRQLTERLVTAGRLKLPAYYPDGSDPMDLAAQKLGQVMSISRSMISLNTSSGDDEEMTLMNVIHCPRPRPEDVILSYAQEDLVRQGLSILTPEERQGHHCVLWSGWSSPSGHHSDRQGAMPGQRFAKHAGQDSPVTQVSHPSPSPLAQW